LVIRPHSTHELQYCIFESNSAKGVLTIEWSAQDDAFGRCTEFINNTLSMSPMISVECSYRFERCLFVSAQGSLLVGSSSVRTVTFVQCIFDRDTLSPTGAVTMVTDRCMTLDLDDAIPPFNERCPTTSAIASQCFTRSFSRGRGRYRIRLVFQLLFPGLLTL
jgi:hypothetical protein